jgi:hypothetical protein
MLLQVHDFSFEWYTTAVVVRRASGTDVNFDFHRSAPYGNLITGEHEHHRENFAADSN